MYAKGKEDPTYEEWIGQVTNVHISSYKELCYHAKRFIDDEQEAEDIVSDLIENLLKSAIYESKRLSLPYLRTCVKNACLDLLDKKQRLKAANDHLETSYYTSMSQPTPDESMISEEVISALHKSVEQLPTQAQKAIRKFFFEQMDPKAIVEDMAVKMQTFYAHRRGALIKLKSIFKR